MEVANQLEANQTFAPGATLARTLDGTTLLVDSGTTLYPTNGVSLQTNGLPLVTGQNALETAKVVLDLATLTEGTPTMVLHNGDYHLAHPTTDGLKAMMLEGETVLRLQPGEVLPALAPLLTLQAAQAPTVASTPQGQPVLVGKGTSLFVPVEATAATGALPFVTDPQALANAKPVEMRVVEKPMAAQINGQLYLIPEMTTVFVNPATGRIIPHQPLPSRAESITQQALAASDGQLETALLEKEREKLRLE
jgi:hypothetical protein